MVLEPTKDIALLKLVATSGLDRMPTPIANKVTTRRYMGTLILQKMEYARIPSRAISIITISTTKESGKPQAVEARFVARLVRLALLIAAPTPKNDGPSPMTNWSQRLKTL